METVKTDQELFTSRPDCQGRLEKEIQCYDFLEQQGIPFTGIDHPAAMTVDDCHNADQKLGIHICKKPVPVQPPENSLLPASDAWQKGFQNQTALRSNSFGPTLFRGAGIPGRTFESDTRLRHSHGTDVRSGEQSAAAH